METIHVGDAPATAGPAPMAVTVMETIHVTDAPPGTMGVLLSQTIAFSPLLNKVLGNAPFPISATASSGLTVGFASTTNALALRHAHTVPAILVNAGENGGPRHLEDS
jgi:hypothetical protein